MKETKQNKRKSHRLEEFGVQVANLNDRNGYVNLEQQVKMI